MTHYVVAHWRGEQSLARSALINGLLGYLALVLIPAGLNQFIPFAVSPALLIACFCWAFVGIVRCALQIFDRLLRHSWRGLSAQHCSSWSRS